MIPGGLRMLGPPLAALLAAGPAQAVPAQPLEIAVKAAFLPKFARYVEWPPAARPAPGEPLRLCVIGEDPFGEVLDHAVAGQRIEESPIVVQRTASAVGAGACHLAFVRGTTGHSTASLLAALRGLPVLTITDSRSGPTRGMIHFAVHARRVSFHVDDAAAAASQLVISSRLLAVALSVRQRKA